MAGPNDSILATVGRTPVVRLNRLAPDGVELHAKLEAFNPMGSVKDRLALGVIEAAERAGELRPGQTVIEATSGNTGIGLAMVCAAKGYPLVVTMAENFSVERRRLMRFLGARVVLTPAADKGTGMVAKARELAAAHGWFLTRQFENEANAEIHVRTTAEEILADFDGRRLDWFVTGAGTGGTLKGVAKVLKAARRPEVRIAVCEPDNAPVLASGIAQDRMADGAAASSHPSFRPHVMQGWAPDFIPKLTGDALAAGHVDRIVGVSGGEALRLSRELARQEGIFCGITGGATLAGALAVAADLPAGASVLFMVPDTGERYLSTPLFQDIPETMTADEEALAASTPGFRIGAAPAAAAAGAAREPTARGAAFVEAALGDPEAPVVLFALEWCEFCWAIRRFFAQTGIAFRSVDLDSVAFQDGDLGGEIRAAVGRRVGTSTIPQVFVRGVHVGGCTETFDAWSDGRLQRLLNDQGVAFRQDAALDPRTLLPGWVHPR